MILVVYTHPVDLLEHVRPLLEQHESLNSLMLGLLQRLVDHPERTRQAPFLGVVDVAGAPHLAAVITPPRGVILHTDLDHPQSALEMLADHLVEHGWDVPGVVGPAEAAAAFSRIVAQRTGRAAHLFKKLRCFELRQVIPPAIVPGSLRPALESEIDRLTQWAADFHREMRDDEDAQKLAEMVAWRVANGSLYVWDNGEQPVCMLAHTRPTRRGITITQVYTPPALRGLGYATSAVAGLSRLLLDGGRQFCTLFTDLNNPISNSIYPKVGYVPLGDFDEYRFTH